MKIKLALAAAAALAAIAPAQAAQKTSGIDYSDLDLSTRRGAAELDKRLNKAAERKCGKIRGGDITFAQPVRDCQKKEMARIRADIATQRQGLAQNSVRTSPF